MYTGLYPAERKAAERALGSIPTSAVTPYTVIKGKEAPNYIAVYEPERHCFFGISAARWLEGNLFSVRNLCTDDRMFREYPDTGEERFGRRKRRLRHRLLLFGMDRFAEDNPDSAIELLPEKLQTEQGLLRYAVTYLKYPESAGFLKDGLSEPLLAFLLSRIRSEDWEEILQAYRTDREFLLRLKERRAAAIQWADIIRLNRYAKLDEERLQRLLGVWDGLSEPLSGIMAIPGNPYTLESLLGYLERCGTYQAIDAEEAAAKLEDYLQNCIRLGIEPDWYPVSLKKSSRLIRDRRSAFYEALAMTSVRDLSKRFARSKRSYAFSQDGYDILQVYDPQKIRTILEDRFGVRYSTAYILGRSFVIRTESDEAAAVVFTDIPAERARWFASYETERHIILQDDLRHLPDRKMVRVLLNWLNRNRIYNASRAAAKRQTHKTERAE